MKYLISFNESKVNKIFQKVMLEILVELLDLDLILK
jgi:hypothetical protein